MLPHVAFMQFGHAYKLPSTCQHIVHAGVWLTLLQEYLVECSLVIFALPTA